MLTSSSSDTVEKKTFNFRFCKGGYDVGFECPLAVPNVEAPLDLANLIGSKYGVPLAAKTELVHQLEEFMQRENLAFFCGLHDEKIRSFTQDEGPDKHFEQWANTFEKEYGEFAAAVPTAAGDSFASAFDFLMHEGAASAVASLVDTERRFADEVKRVIRSRDWELNRLKKEHENVVIKVMEGETEDVTDEELALNASRHFEKLHLVQESYASQLSFLSDEQRRNYRNLVLKLDKDGRGDEGERQAADAADEFRRRSSVVPPPLSPEQREVEVRKDLQISAKSTYDAARREESFTIYLGAQLKTMHNIRLSAMDPIKELCRRTPEAIGGSESLQMLMNLYGDELHGLVLLVGNRSNYHASYHTGFYRSCEQSTELHFDSLEVQLSAVDDCLSSKAGGKGDVMSTGDVYVTRHSNLAHLHVVFHLVADDALTASDINSRFEVLFRHPCINGLRNVIHLCSQFSVNTISIPLLLIDKLTEEKTTAWCLKRAELVFKCVKGYLIEAASQGGSREAGRRHYTVQFLLPADIGEPVLRQIADMLTQIFRLVAPLVAD